MKDNKVKSIIAIAFAIIVVISIISVAVIYLKTDLFKAKDEIFFSKVNTHLNSIVSQKKNQKIDKLNNYLKNNVYEQNISITPEFSESLNTTSANNDNKINNMKFIISLITDNVNTSSNLSIVENDEEIEKFEFVTTLLDDNLNYGYKTSYLDKFYGLENINVGENAQKLGFGPNVGDEVELNNLLNDIQFSDDEIASLYEKYYSIIRNRLKAGTFSKEKDVHITVNSTPNIGNAYRVKLKQEAFNNLKIEVLKELKQDEILKEKSKKLDVLFSLLDISPESIIVELNDNLEYKFNPTLESEKTVYQVYCERIDSKITQIQNNNSSSDYIEISIYDNKKIPIRLELKEAGREYKLDYTQDDTGIGWEFSYTDKNSVKKNNFEFKIVYDNEDNCVFRIEKNKDEKKVVISDVISREITEGSIRRVDTIKYRYDNNEIKFTIENNKAVIAKSDKIVKLNSENYVALNKLTDEEFQVKVEELSDKKIDFDNDFNNKIDKTNIFEILKKLNIIDEQIQIDLNVKATKSEITKFNADFNVFAGEKVNKDNVLRLIDIIEPHLDTFEIINKKTLKFGIKRGNANEVFANKARDIIENPDHKNYKYDVVIKYDNETGIVTEVDVTINET